MAEKPAGTAPEGKGPLAPTSAGFGKGNVPAWLRAHRLNNIGLESWPETPILPKPLFSWRRLPM